MHPRTWRLWHRWLGFSAAVFLLWAGTTGIVVAATEFFGADEAAREHLRTMTSPVTTTMAAASPIGWSDALQRAFTAAARVAPEAPVDHVELRWKADPATVTICTGLRGGGEDRRLVFDAHSGALLTDCEYSDKPFLYRLHSGEAFGDGGLVLAMLWGLALVLLTISGSVIYLQMRRPGARGWRRLFW